MHNHGKKKILAVVDDLLFTVKISDAAKRAGRVGNPFGNWRSLFAACRELQAQVVQTPMGGGRDDNEKRTKQMIQA